MPKQDKKHKISADIAPMPIRNLERALGQNISLSVGSHETGGITHYYSSKLPPMVVDTQNARRKIKVEVYSMEQDNKELLHYLFRKTVER